MSKITNSTVFIAAMGLSVVPALAQTYDLFFVERNEFLTQTGTDSVQAPAWTFENGENGNYYFIAGSDITGKTPSSLSVTNGTSTLNFDYEQVSVLPLSPYFYDGFDVNEASFDINTQLVRQGGGDAPLDWIANVDDQPTDYHQQVIGPLLQLAGDGALQTSLVSPDLDFTTLWNGVNIGGKKVQVVMDAYANREGTEYYSQAALTVASDAPLAAAGQPGSGFSLVFIEDDFGGAGNIIQIWDGDVLLVNNLPNPVGAGGAFVEIYIDDPVDANPWDGAGSTEMVVLIDGTEIFRYLKAGGGYTSNYVTLEGSMQTNGAQLATHVFEDFTVFWGTTDGPSLPTTTEVELEESFASETDLQDATPAGNYEFVSDSGTVATIAMGAPAIPDVKLVKEYDTLQFLDPTFDLTISWDPYVQNPAADDAFLTIEVSYWDESTGEDVLLWETPNTRDSDIIPGIDPTATSVTIPANTLAGSATGNYSINIMYADIMSLETVGATNQVWLESVELHVPVQVQQNAPFWAGYPLVNGSFANTGDFLGLVETSNSGMGWIYTYKAHKYIYVQEEWVTPAGSWVYFPK